MKECFLHLEDYPDLPERYAIAAQSAQYLLLPLDPERPELGRANLTIFEEFLHTPLYQALVAEYKPRYKSRFNDPVFPVIFDTWPMTAYDWHTDPLRTCTINFQLTTQTPSFALFREKRSDVYYHVKELTYVANRPYLFDTQVEHTYMNLSTSRRLVLSIGIYGPGYDEVREFLLNCKSYY